jgi:hypothetical protein
MAVADETGVNGGRVQATLHDAWWSLYDRAAPVDKRAPFQRLPLPDALWRLSDTDAERLTESVRWRALTELARSDEGGKGKLPDFETHERHYKTYLQRFQRLPSNVTPEVVAAGGAGLHDALGQAFQDQAATPTKDICDIEEVVVDGQDAVWIFSEFESKGTHDQLVNWVRPDNWPDWGHAMFKSMSPIGDPGPVPSSEVEQHQNYMEVVSLAGSDLHTILRCDFKDAGDWVGMSYDLVESVGGFLTVDRGFLLATTLPSGGQLVKALKIVGFKDPVRNFLAKLVCPLWTDFARQATRNAAGLKEVPRRSLKPGGAKAGNPPSGGGSRSQTNPPHASTIASGLSDEWIQTMGETVNEYTKQAQDVGIRLLAGQYGREDAARDRRKLCISLVRDWGRVWKAGMDLVNGMASIDVPSTVAGPAVAGGTREFSTVAVPVPDKHEPLAVTDLQHLDSDRAPLKSSQLTIPTGIDPVSEPSVSVPIVVDTTGVEPGLYVGALQVGSGQTQQRTPAHVYVSKAQAAG